MTDNLILSSIYDALLEAGIKKELAIKSLRVFTRKYGGQKIYFSNSHESKRAKEIFDFIYKELDEANESVPAGTSEKITKVFLSQFFNVGEYIPLEFNAFRKEISLEIEKEYSEAKDKNACLIEICKRYNMSFVTFFKIRRSVKEKKLRQPKKETAKSKEKNLF